MNALMYFENRIGKIGFALMVVTDLIAEIGVERWRRK